MIQTGLIQAAHSDLVTDASYDFYGIRLATCSVDQRIKIWRLNEQSGSWEIEDDWKAHDATVSRLSWAHPEFGSVMASASFDRTVKVWEQVSAAGVQAANGTSTGPTPSPSRWVERAMLTEARGTVRAVEFAPHHFGLKLATISTDNVLRIYECLEQPSLTNWQLSEEVDMLSLPAAALSPGAVTRAHTVAVATPTQSGATFDATNASLVTQALQQNLQQANAGPTTTQRPGLGAREADGGWCLSWCKDRYLGEVIAVGCGITGVIKIIQLSPSRRPSTVLVLDPSPPPQATSAATGSPVDTSRPTPSAITTVSWAPSLGRSYHLIATGGRDGRVRIWKVKPVEDGDDEEPDEGHWTSTVVADFDQHKSTVGRVEWNVTGTVLSSAGNDGRIRLWKATSGGSVWRPAGSVGVEQTEERDEEEPRRDEDKDVDMVS